MQGYNEIVAQPHNLPDGQPNDKDILQIKRLIIDVDNKNVNVTKKLVDENYDKIVKFVQDKTTKGDIRIIDKNTKETQIMKLNEFLAKYSNKYYQQQTSKVLQQSLNKKTITTSSTINPQTNIIKENYIYNNWDINNYSNQQLQQQIQQQNYQYQPKMQNIQNIKPTIQQFAPQPNYIQQKKPIKFTTNNQITIKGYTQHHSNRAKKVLDWILSNKLQFSNNLGETDINNFILALCLGNDNINTIFSSLNSGRQSIYNGIPKYYPDIMSNTINNKYNFK